MPIAPSLPAPPHLTTKNVSRHCQMCLRGKSPPPENHCFRVRPLVRVKKRYINIYGERERERETFSRIQIFTLQIILLMEVIQRCIHKRRDNNKHHGNPGNHQKLL
jgi:hypothetical protein